MFGGKHAAWGWLRRRIGAGTWRIGRGQPPGGAGELLPYDLEEYSLISSTMNTPDLPADRGHDPDLDQCRHIAALLELVKDSAEKTRLKNQLAEVHPFFCAAFFHEPGGGGGAEEGEADGDVVLAI
mmetsp:Transcript_14100/g.40085  ORF Transcript_14100/g.40085 Transcript_14100/m.40085 type:complete len:126 (-) Transcript_14100:109-486(-)